MKAVAIITGAVASIPPEIVEKYDITILPFHIIMDGKDYLDIRMDGAEKEQLHQRMMSRQNLPTTSPPSPGEVLAAFKQASQKAKAILYITLTSGLSMGYKSGLEAKERAKEELPAIAIEVIDSQTVSAGEGLIAIEAAKAASQGKSLPEVVEIANRIKQRVNQFWMPDTLFYFDKAGRLGRARSLAGSPVPLAAVLEADISTGGTCTAASRHRTVAKAVESAPALMKQRSGNKKLHAMVGHIYRPDTAEKLKEMVLSQSQPVEFYLVEHAPVTAVLNGAYVDLGFYTED